MDGGVVGFRQLWFEAPEPLLRLFPEHLELGSTLSGFAKDDALVVKAAVVVAEQGPFRFFSALLPELLPALLEDGPDRL